MAEHVEWERPEGSWASSPGVRRSMQGNRGRDTGPEMSLRRLLHARGLRYRVDVRPVKGLRRKADIVFPRQRVCVFVDGCFWHGCIDHGTRPATNRDYWTDKIEGNARRDRETDERLAAEGWTVVRFWEHDDAASAAEAVEAVVRAARASAQQTVSGGRGSARRPARPPEPA
jgi:DNA mismatch endonuclease (patch repair protein)